MKKATRKTKQTLDILHIGGSIGWLGCGFAQLTINFVALWAEDNGLRHAAHEIAHVLDRWPLTAMSVLALVTGVLLGLKTKWGLVQYWWVAVKLALTVLLFVGVPVVVGGWILDAVDRTRLGDPLADPVYLTDRAALMASSVTIVAALSVMLFLSVVKPWKRTPWSRRPARVADTAPRHRVTYADDYR
ncbi:DUF2269 family protein [Fodinicola acaciae]|uniref:DUF2269 family protein n=1 Tax=Fodinicola acaciae TaxID=2681555 RepID=UPI0013D191BC|nr:DUF2269 family protein [Fodinicola acaciae]